MIEIRYNNAAGRLHAILKVVSTQNPDLTVSAAWANAFNELIVDEGKKLHRDDYGRISARLISLWESMNEIEETITVRVARDAVHLYTHDFVQLKSALAPRNMQATWHENAQLVSPAALNALELCARELPLEGELSDDDIQAVLNAIHELRTSIRDSDEFPVLLKEWLLQLLSTVQRAVEHYSLRGGRKLRDALALLAGELFYNVVAKNEIKKHPTIMQRLIDVGNLLLTTAGKAKQVEALIGYSGQAADLLGFAITKIQS